MSLPTDRLDHVCSGVGDVEALPFGCLAQVSVAAAEYCGAHEECACEMNGVVAPQRLGLCELCPWQGSNLRRTVQESSRARPAGAGES